MLNPVSFNSISSSFQTVSTVLYQYKIPLTITGIVCVYTFHHLNDILERAIVNNKTMIAKIALAGGGKISEDNLHSYLKEVLFKKDLGKIKFLCEIFPEVKSIISKTSLYSHQFIDFNKSWKENGFKLDVDDIDDFESFRWFHEIIQFWVEKNFNVNAKYPAQGIFKCSPECSLLHLAIDVGCLEAANYFIDHGADLESKDDNDWTPLHNTAKVGDIQTTKKLLDAGADINARTENYETPLCIALQFGKIELAEHLIDSGADVQSKDLSDTEWDALPRDTFIQRAPLLKAQKIKIMEVWGVHSSPIHLVAQHKPQSIKVIKKLLERGVYINVVDDNSETPITHALTYGKGFCPEVIEFFIDNGGVTHNLNVVIHSAPKDRIILWLEKLLLLGVDINATDLGKETALHLAIRKHKTEIANFLLKKDAKFLVKDENGKIPFDYDTNFVIHWLNTFPEPPSFCHLIHTRELTGKQDPKARMLGKLYETDMEGKTLLHWAAEKNHIQIIELLLLKGMNSKIRDDKGLIPAYYCTDSKIKALLMK